MSRSEEGYVSVVRLLQVGWEWLREGANERRAGDCAVFPHVTGPTPTEASLAIA